MALSKTRQEKYKQARDRAKQLGRQIETDQTNRRQSSVGNGSAPSVPGPLGSSSQNAKNRLSGRGVSGVSGSFPVSDAGTAAYERGVVSAITRQRDEAKADQLRAQARLQALSAGGWSADSPQARQAERETWNSLNASARQKAASERLKEIAASAQERYAREQAVRTARLPDADTLESRLEQAARERYQAEADIQRYSGLGLVLSPGGITENAGRLQEAVRAVEPAKERQEALRKDFDAVRSRDYNREQENQINEWIHAAPAGQGTAPDFSTATTPKQWQAAGAVRILLNPDRAAQTVSAGNAEGTWDATRLSFLTEEEKRAVLAYANAGDWETAANLLEALERTLNARQQESANERLYEESKEHPIVGAAANAILSYGQPYAYLEGVRQVVENAATGNYEPIDPNSFAMSGASLVQQTGQGVVDAVNDFFGKDVSFLTQTGLSILQNMARAPIAWVNPMASLGIMATGAGGASVLEGAQAGKDPAKTVALATAAGLAEYVTERVSLESLLETLKAGKTPLRQALFRVGKQMVTEGSEEAASEYLNLLADAVISGASSGMMQERDALMAAGFSRSEADAMAMTKYMAEQPALSALGGMISGGVMGGGAAALGSAMGALDERAQRQTDRTADAAIDASYAEMQENGLFGQSGEQRQRTQAAIENARTEDMQRAIWDAVENGQQESQNAEDSTAVNTDPAEHTAGEQRVIEEYQAAVDEDLVHFVESAMEHKGENKGRFPLKPVSERAAADIQALTGIDTTGFQTVLEQRIAEHIVDRHGANGAADASMRDVHDIARMQYVLDNYDSMEPAGTTRAYTTNRSNGKPGQAQTVKYIKAVNGTYYIVEAVPDTKAKTTYIVSAFMSKNKKTEDLQTADANAPAWTAKTENAESSVSTPMITEMGLERNGLTREQAGIIARIASGETVSEEEARQVAGSDMATEVLTRTLAERREAVSEQEPVRRQAGEMARPASRAEAQVIEASSVFGENGQRASRAAYDGSISADRYVSGFAEYYEAGLSGLPMDEVQGRYGRALNEAQRLAAYDSGQRDAAAKLREEQARAQYASTAGTDSGLVLDSYVQQNLDDATVNRLNAVSKALGVRVQFADRVRGGTANAQISGADIFVEKGNPNPVLFVVGHEWTHRMQELAPEQYRAFRSAIAGEIQYDARELMARYKEQGVSLTMEEALDEAAADYAGRLLEDGALLDAFIEKHRSDRSLLEKLRDAIRTLLRKLTGKEKQLAQTAEGKLTAALEAAGRQAERLQGQQRNDTMGQTRNSLKEDLEYGRRKESREDFKRGCLEEGYQVLERADIAYGFRRVGHSASEGHLGQVAQDAQRAQQELTALGISADVVDGPILRNQNGITVARDVKQAVTVAQSHIFINKDASLSPREIAGHEAFHLWQSGKGRDAYIDTVEDNLLFTSEAFQKYQSTVAEAYLGEDADLANAVQADKLFEEVFAYISGHIHEGTNDEALRPMFRDYDAVKAAWEALVEENRSGPLTVEEPGDGEHGARYSLKELDGRHMPVIANTSYGALASKPERMAWLKEAKQGNRAAAQRLLDATLKAGLAEQVDEAFPDAVLVPVQYAGEGNVLPQLLAQRLARNGRHSLLETVHQTGRSGMKNHEDTYGRLMNPVQFAFDGPAPDLTGQRFVLVDDVISSGSTLMALKHATEAQGGTVDGYVVLARGRYVAGDMAMKAETLRAIEMRLGRAAVEETLTGRLGYPVTLEALTEKQGRAILSHQEAFAVGTVRALTAAERSAVLQYKSSESYKVNTKLRDGIALTEAEQTMVDEIDRALEKLPRYEGTVYRRMSFDMEGQEALDAFLTQYEAGAVVRSKAYLSSSTEQDGYPVEGNLTVLQVITGHNGRDLDGIGNNFEREVLFPRNTRFYIERVASDEDGNPVVYMEEVAEHGAGQLYPGEYRQAVQQVQTSSSEDSKLQAVPGLDTGRGADRGRVPGVRAEGEEHYSLKAGDGSREAAQLRREADLLRDRVEYWKGQTRKSGEISIDGKATRRAARAILRQFSSQLDVDTLTEGMTDLYNYMLRGGEDFLETEAYRKAEAIARQVVDGALEADDSLYSQYADLRAYLRDTPLSISETDRHDIADFNDFRKRNFGRLNIRAKGGTNIDQIYAELSAQWPEFFDQSRESHPADQLLRMAEVAEQLRQVDVRNPFSDSYWEAVQGAANELYQQFFDTPQARKTFADRQAAKLDAERAKGRRRAAEQRERVERQLETVRQQNRKRVQRAVQRERETRQRQVERLKDRYVEKTAADRERRSAAELRRKITRHAKALSQKLLHPTDKQHIPERLRTPVAALLEAINQESLFTYDRSTGKRQKNQPGAPAKRTEAFRALKEQYAKIVAEGGDMVIDPSLLGSDAEGIRGSFDAVITMGDTRLADMNAEQLATVWQVVKAVEHSVSTSGKILSKTKFAATVDWANAMQRDTASRRAKRTLTKGHPLLDLENPYTFFSHFGDAGRDIYRMLRNAQDQQQLMADEVANAVRSIVSPKTVRNMERTTRTFTTERGDKLALSTAQIMELYELMKRTQAHDHLLKGGIVQPEVESAKIRRGTDAILLTEEDLANIAGTLTDRQVQIADGLQRLTCGLLADYGNRASMDAYGYKKFTEQSYWPIQSAKEGIRSSVERGSGQTRSIANIGFAQAVTPHANNPLDLPGLFSTFSSHAGDMIDYAAWLLPMEDANRLFNFKFRDGEGNLTGKTVKGLLERVGGEGSQRYWHNLMEDIQNGINAPGDSPMWDKIGKSIGNFKGAAVGGNLRVVIQQPTAFFRAAAVLSPADLSRGLAGGVTRGNGWKKALQYSPIAKRKNTGSFDISSPRQMNEILFDDRTPVRKLNDTLSAPAGMADAVTWGRLWNACEWATAREHKSLQKGSEAFYQKVNELFTEVIDQTQVVDGVLQRSNIMRSSNAVVKQATSFMGEPIMSLNLMLRAYDQVRYEQDRKKWRQAVKTLGRAATALVVTNVINALAQSLIDAMRDDDEDKKYWERFWAAFTGIAGEEENFQDYLTSVMSGNLGSGLNPLGQIPFVKDVLSLLQGYDVSRTDMEIISDIVDASELFISSAGGGGSKTIAYAVKSLLAAMAKLFGIPVSNLTRDIWSIARSTAVETDNIPLQYEMEKAIYNITNERNKGRYYDILFRALAQGDIDSYEHIRRELMEQMGVDGASIDSAMRSRYKNAMEKNPNFTLSQEAMDLTGARENYASEKSDTERFGPDDLDAEAYRDYSRQQAEDYREWADRIEAFKGFDWLDDEAKDSILKAAQQLAQDTALRDYSGGQFTDADLSQWERWATGGSEYGVTEAEAILFKAAYDMAESEKDEEGKTVSGSKKENTIELAEELMPYLTDQELEYLMAQFWTPEDDALKERKEKKFMD